MAEAKSYRMGLSIDLSEGLGSDYSIINIFRLMPKTKEEIEAHKRKLTDIYDYFKLEQVGIFKSNIYSVKEVAHILYMITFELFNDDTVKIALERNTYGDELLAHIPHVFNDVNDYSSHVFLKYKQKADDKIAKRGLKINRNKKILIKDYQTHAKKANIVVHELSTITEISTFTKHETPSGDITFKAESGHDDCIMTCITMSSFFGLRAYKDFVDAFIEESGDKIDKKLFTEFVDDWDTWEQHSIVHENTSLAFSPEIVVGSRISWNPVTGLDLALLSKYVGKQFIDNTSSDERMLNAYFVNNIRLAYEFKPKFISSVSLFIDVINILNERYESNAWVYSYFYEGNRNEMLGYYPQAGRHFMMGIILDL
jgi:hypothetical protein